MTTIDTKPVVLRVFYVGEHDVHLTLLQTNGIPLIWDDTRNDYADDLKSSNPFTRLIAQAVTALKIKLSGRRQNVVEGKRDIVTRPLQDLADVVGVYRKQCDGLPFEVHVFEERVPMSEDYPSPQSDEPTKTEQGPGGVTYQHFRR